MSRRSVVVLVTIIWVVYPISVVILMYWIGFSLLAFFLMLGWIPIGIVRSYVVQPLPRGRDEE